jgi:hypothetical protein
LPRKFLPRDACKPALPAVEPASLEKRLRNRAKVVRGNQIVGAVILFLKREYMPLEV